MTGDPDENCISNKELHDFMKAMTELLMKNQAFTTTTYPSIISYYILTSLLMMVLIPINILLEK
jgi:hypothetical protein